MVGIRQRKLLISIFISCFVAWLLMLLPFPQKLHWMRIEWLSLVLIYWVFARPQSIGIVLAWWLGLSLDILRGGLLGEYALSMMLVVYLAHHLHHRVRVFTLFQKSFVILLLVGLGQLSIAMIGWLTGEPPKSLLYWAPTATSVIFWPWIFRFLHYYERHVT